MPDLHGVCIGGAWNHAVAYERSVREYGRRRCGDRLTFLGTRPDVPALYPDLNLVVHPSHSENVGGACESLLLGIPTIATNVGGFPDLIRPGETGWLAPPADPPALAQAMLAALQNPDHTRELTRRGQALTQDLFDVRRTAAEVAAIYHHLLESPRAPGVVPHERPRSVPDACAQTRL